MTEITIQTLSGEISSFTLREDIELADAKEFLALHYGVHEKSLVLMEEIDGEMVACKDYREVSSGDHFHMLINDGRPCYKLKYVNGNAVITTPSDVEIRRLNLNGLWIDVENVRHLLPDQPFDIETSADLVPLVRDFLMKEYERMDRQWRLRDEMQRMIGDSFSEKNEATELTALLSSSDDEYAIRTFVDMRRLVDVKMV
jgi:hypothetical protein